MVLRTVCAGQQTSPCFHSRSLRHVELHGSMRTTVDCWHDSSEPFVFEGLAMNFCCHPKYCHVNPVIEAKACLPFGIDSLDRTMTMYAKNSSRHHGQAQGSAPVSTTWQCIVLGSHCLVGHSHQLVSLPR